MGKIKSWNVTLDEDVVKEAREYLAVGQSLSPVINELLSDWNIQKNLEKMDLGGTRVFKIPVKKGKSK